MTTLHTDASSNGSQDSDVDVSPDVSPPSNSGSKVVVAALYRFAELPDFATMREPLHDVMLVCEVRGTLLLAAEGINGTIAGSRSGVDKVLDWLRKDERFHGLEAKESTVEENPFYRTKVKLKKEIVTMGVEGIDPKHIVGTYVEPKDWNNLINDPEIILIDTRNNYEVDIGTFKHAINPRTNSFREFPEYVKKNLNPKKNKKIAMFCTGGIRCEKASSYMIEEGFAEVYHLKGGILKYLEELPKEKSLWQGECFVFDQRVAVTAELKEGQYSQCYACRHPLSSEEMKSDNYNEGISCSYCIKKTSKVKKNNLQERQKQINLAKARGEEHIGKQINKNEKKAIK